MTIDVFRAGRSHAAPLRPLSPSRRRFARRDATQTDAGLSGGGESRCTDLNDSKLNWFQCYPDILADNRYPRYLNKKNRRQSNLPTEGNSMEILLGERVCTRLCLLAAIYEASSKMRLK
jgi:hypothetical protein